MLICLKNFCGTKLCNKNDKVIRYKKDCIEGLSIIREESHCLDYELFKEYDSKYQIERGKEILDTLSQLEAIDDKIKSQKENSSMCYYGQFEEHADYEREALNTNQQLAKIYNLIKAHEALTNSLPKKFSYLFDKQYIEEKCSSNIFVYDAKDSQIECERMFVDSIDQFNESGSKMEHDVELNGKSPHIDI